MNDPGKSGKDPIRNGAIVIIALVIILAMFFIGETSESSKKRAAEDKAALDRMLWMYNYNQQRIPK